MQNNVLSEEKIKDCLGASLREDIDVIFYDETDSTNLRARELAAAGAACRTLIVARSQTQGRGRLGRSFHSAKDAGLYMTLLLPGDELGKNFVKITRYVAVKLARSIDEFSGIRCGIKWVNDIYAGGRKLSGILVEGIFDESGEGLKYAIIGIGVNVFSVALPSELQGIATSIEAVSGVKIDPSALAAKIAEQIIAGLNGISRRDIIDEYKERSVIIGREVNVVRAGESYPGRVLDINDDGALVILHEDGKREALITGDVSVKPL